MKAYFAELEQTHRVSTLSRKKAALKKAIAQTRGGALTVAEQAQLTEVFREIKTGQGETAVHAHEILTRDELSEILETAGERQPLSLPPFTILRRGSLSFSPCVSLTAKSRAGKYIAQFSEARARNSAQRL